MQQLKLLMSLCLIIPLLILNAKAQEPFTLTGKVTSYEENPLFKVDIILKRGPYGAWNITSSDSLGNFTLPGVYSGDTVSFSGVQVRYHQEVIAGNNYLHVRIPVFRQQIKGAGIESKMPVQRISDQSKRKSVDVGGHWHWGDYVIARPSMYGGWNKLNDEVSNELVYPREALDKHVEGVVVVGFAISIKGEIIKLKVLKGIGSGCDEEVLRILSGKTKWLSSVQNGYPIEQEFEYSVNFSLKKQ